MRPLINRLTRREVEAMIDRVVGNKVLPTNIRQDIIERTDGIPLFVEEMTKAVLEAESQSAAGRTAAAIPSPVATRQNLRLVLGDFSELTFEGAGAAQRQCNGIGRQCWDAICRLVSGWAN